MIESVEEAETRNDTLPIQRMIRRVIENIMKGTEVDLMTNIAENTQILIPTQAVIIRRKNRVKSIQKVAKSILLIFITPPMMNESTSESLKEANIIVIDLKFNF